MADVLCPTCGRPNSNDREFCDFCGNPLDGALPAEPQRSAQVEKDITPEEGSPTSPGTPQDFDEASRLDSFFTDQAPDQEGQPAPPSPGNGEDDSSRLDQYLSPQEPAPEPQTPRDALPENDFESASPLDDLIWEEEPAAQNELASPPSQEDQASSRLESYLGEEGDLPSEEQAPLEGESEDSPLDDFFADDPFKDLDPFQEPSSASLEDSAAPDESPEGFFPPAGEMDLPAELEDKLNASGAEGEFEDPWDLFAMEAESEPSPGEAQAPHTDPDIWNPPETGSEAEPLPQERGQEAPIGDTSAGEWENFSPGTAADQPSATEPEAPEPASGPPAGEWDFLDPGSAQEPSEPEPGQLEEQPGDPSGGEYDWLDPAAGRAEPTQDAGPAESGGEWDFLDPGASGEAPPTSPEGEQEDSGDFDWLDHRPAPDLPEDEQQPQFDSEGFGEDSGWLDMLQDPKSREAPTPESLEPKKPQTDWLEKIKRLNKSADMVDEDSSFPDWLAVSEKPQPQPEQPKAPEPDEDSSEVPDWLRVDDEDSLNEFLRKKDLTNEEYTPQVTEVSHGGADGEGEDAPAAGLSDSQQIKFPSWAEEQKRKEQKAQDLEFMAEYTEDESRPKGTEPFQIEEELFDDLFDEELPDWLTTASSQEIAQPELEELTQGELPGWVEAMRPVVESVDSSGLDEDEDYIENYGPLAGIPSVLPAEAEIGITLEGQEEKPLDLVIAPVHQDYVNLLKKIIGNENKGRTIRRPAPLATQRVLRWLIAIVLLAATAGTVIFGGVIEPQPPSAAQVQGTGYKALYDQVEQLYDGQPVLIAYDYQPATAGELQTAAAGVVDHLMEQGTFLTFVSTQPTGPALAEDFLSRTQAQHGYLHTQKYINLGYLPGESAGLLSFMIAPKQIIPLAFDGSNAWDSPPLIGVDSISDFKMILVITDDPNIAKIWIEQVGARLQDTPLTMVVSAQVEPLIQPYFRSSPQPLAGYVAGIIDSVNYEQLTQRPNLASKTWLPFNIGIIISVGIIFISGLANGVLSLFSRRRTELLGDIQ